jgi:ribulose-phosphate 3-epimerase
MTVEPGFGGQPFLAGQLPKIAELRAAIAAAGHPIHLEVDGGITAATAPRVAAAGADLLVAGTSVFRHPRGPAAAIAALKAAAP